MKEGRKGFTLVELLIVMVVIGVLSAMMMFSSTEAASSAKAAKILGNMTQLKKAVTAWYLDNLDRVKNGKVLVKNKNKYDEKYLGQFIQGSGGDKEILKYLDGGKSSVTLTKDEQAKAGDYFLSGEDKVGIAWYVAYKIGDDMRLREKIAGKASSLGLRGMIREKDNTGKDTKTTKSMPQFDTTYDSVYMLIQQFEEKK